MIVNTPSDRMVDDVYLALFRLFALIGDSLFYFAIGVLFSDHGLKYRPSIKKIHRNSSLRLKWANMTPFLISHKFI